MANTRTPEYNTHNTVRLPLTLSNPIDPGRRSGSYLFDPVLHNCFPVVNDKKVVITKRAPMNNFHAFAGIYPRGLSFIENTATAFLAYDTEIAVGVVHPAAFTTATIFREISDSIKFTDYRVGETVYKVAHEAGPTSRLFFWDISGTPVPAPTHTTEIAIANMSPSIVFMDGYLFIAGGDGEAGQRIYNTTLGTPTELLTDTSFIDAEMHTDTIVGLAKHHNHIVAFGRKSIEFFYNAANELGSPLSRQANYTLKIGTTFGADLPFIEIGDVIYFIGGQAGSYSGIYKLENFKLEKISDVFTDMYLHTANSAYIKLCVYEHLGVPCLLLSTRPTPLTSLGLVYKSDTKTWSTISFNTLPYGQQIPFESEFATNGLEGGVYFFCQDPTLTTNQILLTKSGWKLQASSFAPNAPENVTAVYSPDTLSFDNNNQKHIKWMDVVGSFQRNGVTLKYTSSKESHVLGLPVPYTNCNIKYQNLVGEQHPLRWRNLGRTRGHRYKVEFSGEDDMEFEGLEIAINQGTY